MQDTPAFSWLTSPVILWSYPQTYFSKAHMVLRLASFKDLFCHSLLIDLSPNYLARHVKPFLIQPMFQAILDYFFFRQVPKLLIWTNNAFKDLLNKCFCSVRNLLVHISPWQFVFIYQSDALYTKLFPTFPRKINSITLFSVILWMHFVWVTLD